MSHNLTRLYIHLIWATWDRMPLLTPQIERLVLRSIEEDAEKMGCHVVALNAATDHLHLFALVPPTLAVATLVKQIKGSSSHLANHSRESTGLFRWQGSYGAFSVSRGEVDMIKDYVDTQKARHQVGKLHPECESSEDGESPLARVGGLRGRFPSALQPRI